LALILRGIGLGLLLFPSPPYLSTLSGKNIGEGAAFTGMMRQLDSFGIAIITTFITSQSGASCKFSCSFRRNKI
jgi:DHA2 family multidrug resistance protein